MPNAVHLCVTAALIGCEAQFINDSKAVCDAILGNNIINNKICPIVRDVLAQFTISLIYIIYANQTPQADPKLYADGRAALYGMAGAVPASLKDVMVADLSQTFLDTMTGPVRASSSSSSSSSSH